MPTAHTPKAGTPKHCNATAALSLPPVTEPQTPPTRTLRPKRSIALPVKTNTAQSTTKEREREEQLDCNPHQYEQCTDKACAQQSSPVRRQRLSQKEPRALLLLRLRSCQICIAATRLVEVAHVHAVDTFFLRRRNAWAVAEYTWHTDEGEDALQGEGGAKVGALGE
eukprot:scaffold5540_cov390-Prasinococcus_capsulatus_cf.AAC.19